MKVILIRRWDFSYAKILFEFIHYARVFACFSLIFDKKKEGLK